MSQHPSLKIDSVGVKHRNVLKRHERIQKLQNDNKWPEKASVYRLPKVKSMKVKVKKSAGPKEEGKGEAGAAAPAAAKPAAKPAAKK
jgi:small basic protein (TIGR04137 family)